MQQPSYMPIPFATKKAACFYKHTAAVTYLEHFGVGDMRNGLPAAQEAHFWRLRGQHHQRVDHMVAPAFIITPTSTTAL